MTANFGEYYLSFNLRNGVGIDLEFADSKPVWISNTMTGSISAASFEGIVFLAPFMIVTFGKVWQEDE